jgi:hypothetical protein
MKTSQDFAMADCLSAITCPTNRGISTISIR